MSTKGSALLITLTLFAAAPAQALCVTCNLFLEEDERYWMSLVDNGDSAVIENVEETPPEQPRRIRWFGNGSIGVAANAISEAAAEVSEAPDESSEVATFFEQAGAGVAYATLPAARSPWASTPAGGVKGAPAARSLSPGIVPLLFASANDRNSGRRLAANTLGERVIPNLPELEVYGGGDGEGKGGTPEASKPIPEPTSALVFATGLGLIGSATRRRRA